MRPEDPKTPPPSAGQRPPIGIYLHVPYCRTLCPYCDFVKQRMRGAVPDVFVEALLREIDAYDGPADAGSIFFGGGTPSMLLATSLESILAALDRKFRFTTPEITLEANPDDVTPELVRAWRALGVNRVSLGVQSFDTRVLRHLGRRHDVASAARACGQIAACFDNWNLDLIFGAPPVDAWCETLKQTLAIDPPHVAAYGLTYEPGTPFERKKDQAVDDETSLALYRQAEEVLSAYDHYEISNFAKPGHLSTHNLVYWRNGDYAGFGTGAYSYLDGTRARNHATNDAYLADPLGKEEALALSIEEKKVETLIQHFRLRTGLERAAYEARFGTTLEHDFGETLKHLAGRGLIEDDGVALRPTPEGFYLNNEIGLALVS